MSKSTLLYVPLAAKNHLQYGTVVVAHAIPVIAANVADAFIGADLSDIR